MRIDGFTMRTVMKDGTYKVGIALDRETHELISRCAKERLLTRGAFMRFLFTEWLAREKQLKKLGKKRRRELEERGDGQAETEGGEDGEA